MVKKLAKPKPAAIAQVRKRSGELQKFDPNKIKNAILKAFEAVAEPDGLKARNVADEVVKLLEKTFAGKTPGVEHIQDLVEETLMKKGFSRVAKAYILYRQKRSEERAAKALLGIKDELKLGLNALTVLHRRYLLRDETGKVIETPAKLFKRVAKAIAEVEKKYGTTDYGVKQLEEEFYELMASREFTPNTPTLMNAGTPLGQLSACFVLPIEDSLKSIFKALGDSALIEQSGGGVGYAFSRLRPKGDIVKSTKGIASGPVTFMTIFDKKTEVIKQGGCIASDSLIRTHRGVKPLADLLECPSFGDNPSRYAVFCNGHFEHAFLAEDNGFAEVYDIKTEIGTEVKATYNHQIAVIDARGQLNWKTAETIRPGDWLVHVLGGHCGEDAELPEFKENVHFNTKQIRLPKKMSQELAELLGIYMADGCISGNRLIFAVEDKDIQVKQRIAELMSGLFDIKTHREEQKPDDKSICMVFHSKILAKYFELARWTKSSAAEAFVPRHIFESSVESARAFVRGLFEGDGDVHIDGYPRLYSISERLIKEVQQLLFGIGIVSTYHKYARTGNSYGKNPICHLHIIQELSIEEFKTKIGFISDRKNAKIRSKPKANEPFDVIPNQHQFIRELYRKSGVNRTLYRSIQHFVDTKTSQRNLTRKKATELLEKFTQLQDPRLQKLASNEYFYARVAEINKTKAHTADISVPVSEHFVANSILVHNKRRGALMGILRVDHPDIVEFITAKSDPRALANFNISVAVTDEFMQAVQKNKEYELINPRDGKVVKKLKAREVWDLILSYAWKTGDPGVVFIDEINKKNPTAHIGEIESTNPCGETPLHPYEACNLGSINLAKMIAQTKGKYELDWSKLKKTVHKSIQFLDNVVDASKFPIPEITEAVRANRRIGLGVMGWAELLLLLNIKYDSEQAIKLAEKLMKFINEEAHEASQKLGQKKGSFPNFKGSLWDKLKYKAMRNATSTTIAPTGTISIISGCSSGIEPLFAISFIRNVLEGTRLLEVNKIFEEVAKKRGFYSEELMNKIAKTGSIQGFKEIPKDVKDIFVTALDIKPEWHVKMQAAFQKYTDNAVSKTINFPPDATVADVRKAYELAYKLKCKGITIYRYGSKPEQVLYIGEIEKKQNPEAEPYVVAQPETAGWCSSPLCPTP